MNSWPKMVGSVAKWGINGAMLTPTNSFLLLAFFYVCANSGKNRSRNATVRVLADGYTD